MDESGGFRLPHGFKSGGREGVAGVLGLGRGGLSGPDDGMTDRFAASAARRNGDVCVDGLHLVSRSPDSVMTVFRSLQRKAMPSVMSLG